MTTLTSFTSYDSIRATLGVSSEELEDSTLADLIYYTQLTEEYRAISTSFVTDYLALSPVPPTVADNLRFYNLVQTYSAYFIASKLIPALPLFAPRHVKDSQAAMDRVIDPFKEVAKDVQLALGQLKLLLEDAYATLNPAVPAAGATPRVMVTSTGLGLDPITGV